MTDQEIRETLEKQLQLLSERSSKATSAELLDYTKAMLEIMSFVRRY